MGHPQKGMYLDGDNPGHRLAGVGATLDGDAQGGCTLRHADQGGRGLQESGLWVRVKWEKLEQGPGGSRSSSRAKANGP